MPPMSASEHLLSRIRAHIPAGYWRVLSVYRVAHGGATSAAVRRPVCSLPMVVTGSLALGMDGGGAQTRWAAARTCNPWASAAALAASRRVDAGCSSCAPGCCPARRSPSGRVGSRPPGPDQRCARPRAHAPGTQRPAPLRVRRARAHRSARLRAARDIHRARLLPWQARDGRDRKRRADGGCGGPGVHARARVKPAGASVRRLCGGYVYCYVNSLTHTQTHTKTRPARRKMPWS